VNAIGAFRPGSAAFAQSQRWRGFPGDALRISPRGGSRCGSGCEGGARILLANQNLLHLVFKWLLNTKHSGEVGTWQALFDAQKRGAKTTTKTAACGGNSGISNDFPPAIHRLVHKRRTR
jgi:hypothetical protein